MTMNDATNGTNNSQYPDYFKLVPIKRTQHVNQQGQVVLDWKGPIEHDWNADDIASQYRNVIYDGYNAGICHKQSGTCAFDIDDYGRTAQILREHGLNLAELITTGVQISSGKQNRAKLLYRLPEHIRVLEMDYPVTYQHKEQGQMVYELRCVSTKGRTLQDVVPPSLHPDTQQPYRWVGDPANIPVIPDELLSFWEQRYTARRERNSQFTGTPDTPDERAKVARALATVDPDCDWNDWISVGFALHSTTWPDAFDLWLDWSSRGSKFVDANVYAMSHDFDNWDYGGGINITWLYAQAYAVNKGWDQRNANEMFQALDTVTVDNDTQQIVEGWEVNLSRADPHMDANTVEQWVDYILQVAVNRADQVDKLRDLAHVCERYSLTELRPMLTAARRRRMALANAGGDEIRWLHGTGEENRPLTTIENFHILLHHYDIKVRYNQMTKSLELDIPNTEFHSDTEKNSQIIRMESYMIQHGMNSRQAVGYCNLTAQDEQYHPFREYIDSCGEWDGIDRISMLADTLKVPEGKERLRDVLLRRWLVSIPAAAFRDTDADAFRTHERDPAPRGVLTLQGEQYIGKTRWFRNIIPDGFFKEGLELGHTKDDVKQATNCLVVEIGEADTSTKQDAGRVKAFLSRDYDELRVPWDKAESRWPRRTVFGGTVNPDKFLTDTTGNTRWWTVPVLEIDFMLLSFISLPQLWLQVNSLWEAGEPYLLTEDEMAELNGHNQASQQVTPFEDAMLDLWHFDTMEGQDLHTNWMNLADITNKMKAYGVAVPRDTSITKEVLYRLTGGMYDRRRRWKLPALRSVDRDEE